MARKSTATAAPRTRGNPPARRTGVRKTPAKAGHGAEPNGHGALAPWPTPAHMAAAWTQFAEQMQRASAQTWGALQHDVEAEAEDIRRADTPQQLAGAPIGLAAEQLTRWMQLSNQLAASLLDVQTAWFRQVEAAAAQVLAPLVSRDGHIAFASAQDLVEPPEPNGPMQALWSAQKLWAESTKVWLNAVSHDLQGDAPRAR